LIFLAGKAEILWGVILSDVFKDGSVGVPPASTLAHHPSKILAQHVAPLQMRAGCPRSCKHAAMSHLMENLYR